MGLFLPLIALAKYDILIENDTAHTLYIKSIAPANLDPSTHSVDNTSQMQPYSRKQVQWVNYDSGIKNGKDYSFNQLVFADENCKKVLLKFVTIIHGDLIGSHITSSYVIDKSNMKKIFYSDNPKPHDAKLVKQNVTSLFKDSSASSTYAVAIKYTVPNKHFNFQGVDAMDYVIQDQQPRFMRDNDNSKSLTVLAYNMQVWPFYGAFGGMIMNRPDERIKDVAELARYYDVVVAEELMSHQFRNNFNEYMRAEYPYQYGPMMNAKSLSGGVMIYSHWPIVADKGIIYKNCSGVDCNAAKGALFVKIKKGDNFYNIFGTHTQADEDSNPENLKKDRTARNAQLLEMQDFIVNQNIPKNQPILVAGDFNVDAVRCQQTGDCQEYNDMLNTLKAHYEPYTNIKLLPYISNKSLNGMSTDANNGSYDYILSLLNQQYTKMIETHVRVMRATNDSLMYVGTPYGDTDLSDHFALEAKLTVSPYPYPEKPPVLQGEY